MGRKVLKRIAYIVRGNKAYRLGWKFIAVIALMDCKLPGHHLS